jgi:hypothetical protein
MQIARFINDENRFYMNPGYPFSISIFIPDSNTSALFYPNSNNIEALIPPGNVSLSHLSYLINCHIDYL